MNLLTFTNCCIMLGIDLKTLRDWKKQAHMQWTAHPTDARLKCLTPEQVQQLASLHDRPLSSPLTAFPGQENETLPSSPTHCIPEADLGQSLARLQAQVATMQEQLTGLALELLRERDLRLQLLQERQQRTEERLSTLEALLPPVDSPPLQAPSMPNLIDPSPLKPFPQRRSPRPGSARGGRGSLPLIAYTATGSYVVICPTSGELPLLPDSPEWFEWLATLTSFRFLGRQGRLSASRPKERPNWMAYRRIHKRRYNYGLGNTKRLTLAHLEQMAATLQSYAPSLS